MSKKQKLTTLLLGAVVIIVVTISIVFKCHDTIAVITDPKNHSVSNLDATVDCPTVIKADTFSDSGAHLIHQDLGLFKVRANIPDCNNVISVQYFDAGAFSDGPYAGYKRVIVYFPDSYLFFLAVLMPDGKYLVDKSFLNYHELDEIIKDFDLTKVALINKIDDRFPDVIKLNENLFLKDEGLSSSVGTSDLIKVSSPEGVHLDHLKWFERPYVEGSKGYVSESMNIRWGTIVLVDAGGLRHNYYLSFIGNAGIIRFNKTAIKTTNPVDLYGSYGDCGGLFRCSGRGSVIKVLDYLAPSESKLVGKVNGVDLYALNASQNHPLYTYGYATAKKSGKLDISLEQYIARNPFLFFKDPFGRFILLEQQDYLPAGGYD